MVKVNFAGVDDPGFESPPKGWYTCTIEDVDSREVGEKSKHPGNEFWNVTFDIAEGDYKGRKLFTNLMLPCQVCAEAGGQAEGHEAKDYSPFMLLGILKAAGWVDPNDDDPEIDVEAGDLEGLKLDVYARPRKDDAEQADVRKFRPAESADKSDVV